MDYDVLYNIHAGIWTSFNNKQKQKLFSVKHGNKKKEEFRVFFSPKFETFTRENFVTTCLYIQFIKKPSSLMSSAILLKDMLDNNGRIIKEILDWKTEIIHYAKFIKEDIEFIRATGDTSVQNILQLYYTGKIRFYTFYFYLEVKKVDMEKMSQSRVTGYLIKDIEKLMVYVTFKEESKKKIKDLIDEYVI